MQKSRSRQDPCAGAKRTVRGFRWWTVLPLGRPQCYAVLGARVAGGQVTAFMLFIGAAGD